MKSPPALLEPRGKVTIDDYIVDIAWSADGSRLAVAGGEGKVCSIENGEGTLVAREVGHHGLGALAVAWHPQNAVFVSSGQDAEVRL
jgi:WD40 repeat protein